MGFELKMTTNNFDRVRAAAKRNLPLAVFAEGTEIMADSQANYCPVLTGELRRSGRVQEPQSMGADQYVVILGYDAEYAIVVHEAPPGEGQGKAKYLEIPFNNAARGFETRVANRARNMLGL